MDHVCRKVIKSAGFGVYLPEKFGVRLKYDVYIHKNRVVEINGGIQEKIEYLM